MPAKLTTDEFIEKAIQLHGNTYEYGKTSYLSSHTKVTITCKIHGDFSMKPNNHLSGKQGCPICKKRSIGDKLRKSTEDFIAQMQDIYGDAFDLSEVVYKTAHTPVVVTHYCGNRYSTTPTTLLKGKTCNKCSIQALKQNTLSRKLPTRTKLYNLEDYVILGEYVNSRTPIEVMHKPCNTKFKPTPDNLLNKGVLCPKCSIYGFNPEIPATLYYLSINDGMFFKIGITNRSVQERFSSHDLSNVTVLKEWHYEKGKTAFQKEQELFKLFESYRITSKEVISSGYTELFTTDILKLGIIDETYFTTRTKG